MKYHIYLEGTVGYAINSHTVAMQLAEHKGQHVNIRLSSLGGDVVTALNIYTLLREHGDVTVYLVGAAASAATIIACGAKEIKIDSSCMFLVHKCSGYVFEWGSMNEEQLEQLIKDLQKQADDQKTIDGIIANIYTKRNGKSIEDNIKIMSAGAWLNAEKAKEYGLVDSIFEIEDGQEKNLSNQFRNSISIINGVENPPSAPATDDTSDVVDANGEPTESFVQKTLNKMRSLFHTEANNNKIMKFKMFCILNALLAVQFLDAHEDNVLLTQDQTKAIEDEIQSLRNQLAEKDNAITAKDAEIQTLNDKIADLDNQIQGFKDNAPDAGTNNVHEGEDEGDGEGEGENNAPENLGRKLFNQLNDL